MRKHWNIRTGGWLMNVPGRVRDALTRDFELGTDTPLSLAEMAVLGLLMLAVAAQLLVAAGIGPGTN